MRRDRQRFARASCGHDRCRRRGVPSPTTGQARASSIGREVFAEDASATLWTSLGTWTSLHAHEQPQRRRRKNQRAHKARPEQHLLVRTVAGTQSQCVLPRDAKDNTNTWPRRTQTRREETRGGTRSSSAQRRQRSMAPRESGTHWPPGWRTQDERTSTGTRGERLVEKNGGAKDGAKGVAHNECPASRRTNTQVGRMVERGQSDKGKRGTATQTWGHARKEILRRLTRNTGHSQRGTAAKPAAASATGTRGGAEAKRGLRRRWPEQRRECSTEERPKEGREEGGNEQGS
ncbi:hypothetical protein ERJ75_001184700 [Trypanosoma vivax]|nr:hypothetical protein ERJ75_001184700 [Trypanosoma vivax]